MIFKSTGLGTIKRHKSRVDFNYFLNVVILPQKGVKSKGFTYN